MLFRAYSERFIMQHVDLLSMNFLFFPNHAPCGFAISQSFLSRRLPSGSCSSACTTVLAITAKTTAFSRKNETTRAFMDDLNCNF